jgi:hypothetical protein
LVYVMAAFIGYLVLFSRLGILYQKVWPPRRVYLHTYLYQMLLNSKPIVNAKWWLLKDLFL